jgi:hypothetical protein
MAAYREIWVLRWPQKAIGWATPGYFWLRGAHQGHGWAPRENPSRGFIGQVAAKILASPYHVAVEKQAYFSQDLRFGEIMNGSTSSLNSITKFRRPYYRH